MLLRSINAPLTAIQGIRSRIITENTPRLARLGIHNTAGLLCHYPRGWQDRRFTVTIAEFQRANVCTEVTVLALDWIGFGQKRTPKVYIEDESGRAVLVRFKQPWFAKEMKVGGRYKVWGIFEYKYGGIQSSNFEFEESSKARFFGRIVPVYPLSAGLKQSTLRLFTDNAIEQYAALLENELPDEIIARDNLLPKAVAVRAFHYPSSPEELEQAKKTLIYEELFYLEVLVGKRAYERRGYSIQQSPVPSPSQQRLLERLPFSLTSGQQKAITEINTDMGDCANSNFSMARLLQGDVGSGKTLVSFLAALRAADNGGQTALLAPTELLARQHAENAARLLEPLGLRIAFLTGNIKAAGRKDLLKHLEAGEIDIAVGTHALFSKDVNYKNLQLVIIDEQHRFGVTQRALIMAKGLNGAANGGPHLLMMSATPIPRTLAMTVFGDMDVSLISDMPPGRKPVITHLARESNEQKVYEFVRDKLKAGSQAYFVYPLIESADETETALYLNRARWAKVPLLKDAVSMADRLATEIFPGFTVALIHSRLDEEEKRQTMEDFRKGEIRVLVATSVVEVGVDVPNANCMVIEHAERFGLSALHQLRGRVGRGQDQAYCFLVYSDNYTDDGKARLNVMYENNNGFVIAEEDLKLRGPGQIAGTEQSGYLSLGIANPIRDIDVLTKAREDAFSILENDPGLVLAGHRIIARVLDEAPPFTGVGL
ncbi:MAG: ATP-dependent DNA helicase RecG [Treponema sp.]|jgi:ATP-dependent DNA helicase RecG|nr:ATP-dependent DNA helicase RecG [Treponema sp.]